MLTNLIVRRSPRTFQVQALLYAALRDPKPRIGHRRRNLAHVFSLWATIGNDPQHLLIVAAVFVLLFRRQTRDRNFLVGRWIQPIRAVVRAGGKGIPKISHNKGASPSACGR